MLHLVTNGQPNYRIILPEKADATLAHAARELARYIGRMSGAAMPMADSTSPAVDREICLGHTGRAGETGCEGLKNDGYRISTSAERIFIQGDGSRGVLYGVYGFLEECLGCRFFAEGAEHIPQRATIDLPPVSLTRISPLEYRETLWNCMRGGDIAVKRGFNGQNHEIGAHQGGNIRYFGFVHTFGRYVDPDEYFDEHPEYFSMVNGKRIREQTQLCLTNPEVLAIVVEKLRRNIQEHPEAKIFSISQNDCYNPCTCPECARVDAEEGSHAGTLIRFVNAVAEAIAKDYPDVLIDTLAYQYTRTAPKLTRPAPNVCVRICTIECCFSHPLEACDALCYRFVDLVDKDSSLQQDFLAWSRICDRIFVWDYTTDFRHYLCPFPNFASLAPNMRFFVHNGVTGLFEQGNGESVSGEFGELRAYLISRLMWNLEADVDKEMDEFLTGYYGRAAGPIRAYIDMIQQKVARDQIHVTIYDNPTQGHLPDELLERAVALWDEAEALADNEQFLWRVQKSRMQVRYTQIHRMPLDAPDRDKVIDDFIADLDRFGITHIREHNRKEQDYGDLRAGTMDARGW